MNFKKLFQNKVTVTRVSSRINRAEAILKKFIKIENFDM